MRTYYYTTESICTFYKFITGNVNSVTLSNTKFMVSYVCTYGTTQFKLYTRVHTRFTRAKVYNVECIFLVAHGFVMHTHAIK